MLILLQSAKTYYYKVLQLSYYEVLQVLLQSAKDITKGGKNHKVRQNTPFCKLTFKVKKWLLNFNNNTLLILRFVLTFKMVFFLRECKAYM